MATVEENRHYWEEVYPWLEQGEEWSRGWGGTENLWQHTLFPRISRFLPAASILEIAPGHGRFTPYLLEHCQTYRGIDLSPSCVEICRQRFPETTFESNDGRTLPSVKDASVDFIFSFFSLIHADIPTMRSYLEEFARVLTPTGSGFIHHSNLAEHQSYFRRIARLPRRLREWLFKMGLIDLPQWREPTVSAEIVARLAQESGLFAVTQEAVNFGSHRTIDAFTSFVRADIAPPKSTQIWDHPGFMHEAMRIRLSGTTTRPPDRFYGPIDRLSG